MRATRQGDALVGAQLVGEEPARRAGTSRAPSAPLPARGVRRSRRSRGSLRSWRRRDRRAATGRRDRRSARGRSTSRKVTQPAQGFDRGLDEEARRVLHVLPRRGEQRRRLAQLRHEAPRRARRPARSRTPPGWRASSPAYRRRAAGCARGCACARSRAGAPARRLRASRGRAARPGASVCSRILARRRAKPPRSRDWRSIAARLKSSTWSSCAWTPSKVAAVGLSSYR